MKATLSAYLYFIRAWQIMYSNKLIKIHKKEVLSWFYSSRIAIRTLTLAQGLNAYVSLKNKFS